MGKDILLVDFNVLMNYDYAIWSTYRIINKLEPLKPCKEIYVQLENRERLEPLSIELPSLSNEDLFDTKIMEILSPTPSIVCKLFQGKYIDSPQVALY